MNSILFQPIRIPKSLFLLASIWAALILTACGSDEIGSDTPGATPTGNFQLRSLAQELVLVEGDENGLVIPIELERSNGHQSAVELSISGRDAQDVEFVTSSFTRLSLTPDADQSSMVVKLAIADQPLLPQERNFLLTATDGRDIHEIPINVSVQPVDAPDVYLLLGQSNMVGFSGDGTKQAYENGPDEPNPRIKQLNATKNDRQDIFRVQADFTSATRNVVAPVITIAEDPLHIPQDDSNTSGKDLEYIGLGLSFAKSALPHTSRDIVLVPAAWSGSSFCLNEDAPNGQWNAQATDNPVLGNTWLFDRAVTRANLALQETGGILRGILWHQGESDANERCAPIYGENLERLVYQLRLSIAADQRGGELRRPDSRIPFVVGTMSRGADDRGDLSEFSTSKQLIDDAHRSLADRVPTVGLSVHDDLVPANGYPCGNTTCIHFGPDALREMGARYYNALGVALR